MPTGTCLLIAERFEPTADLLIAELRRRGLPCVRWNLDDYPIGSTLTFRASANDFGAEITTDGRSSDLDDVGSVWCRDFRASGFPADLGGDDRRFAETEARRMLTGLLADPGVIWINHPLRQAFALSKPAQLRLAREAGLEIPRTVISNDPDQVRAFIKAVGTRVVYKTLSQSLDVAPGYAVFTGELTERQLESLELVRVTPGIFQELLPKQYEVRTTVVGRRLFSAAIDSQARAETTVDWRHIPLDLEHRPVDLPATVEDGIRALMDALGLVYGAFDFIVTPEGRHVFLEVNPAGQYMWIESKTGLAITAALADALSEPCRRRRPGISSKGGAYDSHPT